MLYVSYSVRLGYKRSTKRSVLSQGCLDKLVIKGPARLTALLFAARAEETEAPINRKYRIL
jgi:hypothetical protein